MIGTTDAITVNVYHLYERIQSLREGDRGELADLFAELVCGDPERSLAAVEAIAEILSGSPTTFEPIAFEAPCNELQQWMAHIGCRIREARQQAGMTQIELAEASGLPQSHISRLENGEHSPTKLTREKLAKAVGLPSDSFEK